VRITMTEDCVEALRLRHIQRPQDERIHHAEYHGVCADRQRQRPHGDDRKAGRLPQDTKAEAHILDKSLDEIAAHRFVAFPFEPLTAAELDARAAFGLSAIQAGTFKIVGAVLDMRAKLLLDLIRDLIMMKKLTGNGAIVGPESHISSGRVPRAEAIAVARRFHPSVSSCSRLRPAAVSS
jgi:hypothetical protein